MKRRQTLLTLVSSLVILAQLAQPLGLGPTAAAARGSQGRALPALAVQPAEPARPPWARPAIEAQSPQPALTPPTDLGLPTVLAGPTFGVGNHNYGQPYNDIGNPEDHPGRHFAGPVNLVNGNVYLPVGDHFFPATGVSVQFARSYNSQDILSGPLGPGWTHSYNAAVIQGVGLPVITGTTATLRNGDGSQHTYVYNGSQWVAPLGYFHTLQHNAPGDIWVRTHKNGVVETFDPQGKLLSIADRNGNEVTLVYALGQLVQVVDPSNTRSLTITNNLSGTIGSISDPLGRQTTYEYNGAGRLVRVGYPEGITATYTYNGLNQLIAVDDPRLAPEMGPTQFAYNLAGMATNVTYTVDSFVTIVYSPTQTTWLDSAGANAYVMFDGLANIVQEAVFVNGLWRVDQWQYFGGTVIAGQRTDANGRVTQYVCDPRGNILRVVSPAGASTLFEYEPTHNNVISTTNAAGQVTRYVYDANGNLEHEYRPSGEVVTFTVGLDGNLLGVANAVGSTSYAYDGLGNLVTVTDPAGHTTTNAYDAVGRPITTTDPGGYATVYAYDAADRLTRVLDPLGGMLEYEYDAYSNLSGVMDPNGHHITQTYNALNRLTSVTDHMGNSTFYQWTNGRLGLRTDAEGLTTTFSYDGANRLVGRTYSDGRHDTFVYDAGGRLTAHGDGTITTTTQYDLENRPFTITVTAPDFSGPVQVEYQYDALGNRTRTRLIDSTSDFWDTLYQYDSAGRLVQTTDEQTRLWTTTYDAAGRRATRTLPDDSHEEYFYDARGNLVRLDHFDDLNVLRRSFQYSFDARTNLINEVDGSQTAAYQYDALGRMVQVNTPQGPITYGYTPGGLRTSVTGPGDLNTTYAYDQAGHLTSTNDRTYQYDAMGRRIAGAGPDGNSTYAYDGEMRLEGANTPDGAVQLDYDPMGRLIHRTGGSVPEGYFLHGPRGLEAELTPTGAFSRTHTIDIEIVALNLVSVSPIEVRYTHYDGRGRVRWVTDGAGQTVADYGTDPSGGLDSFYNPIRLSGGYFFPELNLYLIGDGLFWDPVVGVFLNRLWPWSFWPFGPWSPWRPIFRFWPWPWLWPRPWGWPWPRPWAFLWPWPGAWVRPWNIWPLWPWPVQPWWPWWWWWHWWWWPWWGHWWHWWWQPWWHGWWWWPCWGGWWWWHWWWWPWWWWWPCWWLWWVWWWPWWWGWGWWWWPWWWGWGWWWWPWRWGWWWWGWWWWWPLAPRPPDYGDAPDPLYPSLRANDGARHLNPDYEWLGPGRSREYDARLTNIDTLDDGVSVNTLTGVMTFTVSTSGYWWRYSAANPLHVHGWIDWNADGDWDDPGEMVADWTGYPGSGGWPALTASHTVTMPVTTLGGGPLTTWARFRLDYDQDLESVTGPARYGEVEDLSVFVPARVFLPVVTK